MQKSFKSLVLVVALAALPAGRAAAAEPAVSSTPTTAKPLLKPTDLFSDSLVAKGKGFQIKRSQFEDALISVKASFTARGQTLSPEQSSALETSVLDNIIQMQLLLAKANDADKAQGQSESLKRFEVVRTNAGSDEALARQLKAVALTAEDLRKNWADDATAKAVLERELKVSVGDEQVKKYYEDNPSKFEQPEMVRVLHILLSTRDAAGQAELPAEEKAAKRKHAEALLKRARAGEDFATLLQQNTEDPRAKQTKGEITFSRATADQHQNIPTEFEIAAFALKTNEISEVVTSSFGYHLIKLLEKIPAHKVELEKVSSFVKERLTTEELQKQAPEYLAKLKKDADIEILDDTLKERYKTLSLPPGHPPVKSGTPMEMK